MTSAVAFASYGPVRGALLTALPERGNASEGDATTPRPRLRRPAWRRARSRVRHRAERSVLPPWGNEDHGGRTFGGVYEDRPTPNREFAGSGRERRAYR